MNVLVNRVSLDSLSAFVSDQGAGIMTTAPEIPSTASEAARTLRDSLHAELHRLEVTETDMEVIITGIVPSFYLKSLAQETVRPILRNRRLTNQVTVNR